MSLLAAWVFGPCRSSASVRAGRLAWLAPCCTASPRGLRLRPYSPRLLPPPAALESCLKPLGSRRRAVPIGCPASSVCRVEQPGQSPHSERRRSMTRCSDGAWSSPWISSPIQAQLIPCVPPQRRFGALRVFSPPVANPVRGPSDSEPSDPTTSMLHDGRHIAAGGLDRWNARGRHRIDPTYAPPALRPSSDSLAVRRTRRATLKRLETAQVRL